MDETRFYTLATTNMSTVRNLDNHPKM